MGRNNRQRRAAKQKSRTRRGPTPPRSAPNDWPFGWPGGADPADEFAELFDEPDLDDFAAGDATGAGPAAGSRPRSARDRAPELLQEWVTTAWRQSDGQALRRWADRQLLAADDEVLGHVDELLGQRMVAGVSRLWKHGWQPRDLLHVAQRIDKRAAILAADLTVEQLRISGRLDLAPEDWREQLRTAEARARTAGLRPARQAWTPLGRMQATGAGPDEALASALLLEVRISQLPALTVTLPPPHTWRPQGSGGPSATGPRAPSSDARRDKVLVKIRALLAKAESTEHPAEADTFTAKAQALMTRHAIDEALLHAGADESVDVRSSRVLIDHPYPLEKMRLLNEVALANRVKVIWASDLAIATVVGTPVDIDQVEMLFVSLLIQATRAMAEAGARGAGSFDRSATFRRSFLTSYAIRISERLKEADAEAAASYGATLVPVLQRQQEAVEKEFERLFPNTTHVSSRRSYDRRGWQAGRDAADRATFVAGRIAS